MRDAQAQLASCILPGKLNYSVQLNMTCLRGFAVARMRRCADTSACPSLPSIGCKRV